MFAFSAAVSPTKPTIVRDRCEYVTEQYGACLFGCLSVYLRDGP